MIELRVGKLQSKGQILPLLVVENKVHWNSHSPVHLCIVCGCLGVTTAGFSSWDGNWRFHNAQDDHCLALCRTRLWRPGSTPFCGVTQQGSCWCPTEKNQASQQLTDQKSRKSWASRKGIVEPDLEASWGGRKLKTFAFGFKAAYILAVDNCYLIAQKWKLGASRT